MPKSQSQRIVWAFFSRVASGPLSLKRLPHTADGCLAHHSERQNRLPTDLRRLVSSSLWLALNEEFPPERIERCATALLKDSFRVLAIMQSRVQLANDFLILPLLDPEQKGRRDSIAQQVTLAVEFGFPVLQGEQVVVLRGIAVQLTVAVQPQSRLDVLFETLVPDVIGDSLGDPTRVRWVLTVILIDVRQLVDHHGLKTTRPQRRIRGWVMGLTVL